MQSANINPEVGWSKIKILISRKYGLLTKTISSVMQNNAVRNEEKKGDRVSNPANHQNFFQTITTIFNEEKLVF